MAHYPHPIIAREGWPFLAGASSSRPLVTWLGGWWSAPFWLVAALRAAVLPRPAAGSAAPARASSSAPADGRDRAGGQGARRLPRARRGEDQRLHERLQRPLEPLAGRRRRSRTSWYFPGLFVNADLDKASTDNERNARAPAHRVGNGRHLPCRWPGSSRGASCATWARATGSRAASATGSSVSARASTCTFRPARRRRWRSATRSRRPPPCSPGAAGALRARP